MPRTLTEQEYNAVKEQVMQSAPPNMDEATFTRWIGPQMHAALVEAELKPPMQHDPAAWRFVAGAASMLNPIAMVEGVANAVRHPIDTVSAIGHDMADQGRQAIDAAQQGRMVEAVGHGTAAMLPVIGPAAAHVGEQGASGDVAGALGGAAGLVLPFLAKPGLSAARRLVPASAREAAATGLEAGANSRYEQVMAPQVGPNKTRFGNMAKDVAPELASDPNMSALSRTGLQGKVEQAFESAKAQLDAAADSRNKGAAFDTKPILDSLQKARAALVAEAVDASHPIPEVTNSPAIRPARAGTEIQVHGDAPIGVNDLRPDQRGYRTVDTGEFAKLQRQGVPIGQDVEPAPNAPRIASIDQVIDEVTRLGPVARYESLRRIRQAWDSVAKAVYSPAMTADYMKAQGGKLGAADATAAIREHLANIDPTTAAANEKYSLYKKAQDVLDATAEVERTRPKVGRAIMARLSGTIFGGTAAGPLGAGAGFVLGPTVESILSAGGTTKLVTAQLMEKLAGAIRNGDMAAAESLAGKLKSAATKLAPATAAAVGNLSPAMAGGSPPPTPSPTASR